MKIYTRTGDTGQTALFGGGRVPKNHLRVEAYGDVDELNAVLGAADAHAPDHPDHDLLESIQRDLFAIGGQLATPDPGKVAEALAKARLEEDRVSELERHIDRLEEQLAPLRSFILPAGAPRAAALHHARTVARRAERRVVALQQEEPIPPIIPQYLNRLSDLLFTLARHANLTDGVADVSW